jgi:hypothetical protein
VSDKKRSQINQDVSLSFFPTSSPKKFLDLRPNRPAAPNATIGPHPSPAVRRQQRRQAHLTGNYPNPLMEPRGINQTMATPRRADFITPTAGKTAKDLTKKAVGGYFGSTPKEIAIGAALEIGIPVAGTVLSKTAKGIYGVGKSMRQAYKNADSMVPGNRPPRPKTPTAPANPADVEGRRNVLKGGLVVAAGGAAAASKNVEEVVDFGQQVLRRLKGQGRRVLPKGFLQGFGKYDYQDLKKRYKQELRQMTDDFDPEFDPNDFGGIGHVQEEAADFVRHNIIQGVISRSIPRLPQRAKNLLGLGKDAKNPFVMSDIEDGIEQAMLTNVHRSFDSKVPYEQSSKYKPLFNLTSHLDHMVKGKDELLDLNEKYKKRIRQHIDSLDEKTLTQTGGDMSPAESIKFVNERMQSLGWNIRKNQQLLNSIDRAPKDLITEEQVREVLRNQMRKNVYKDIERKVGKEIDNKKFIEKMKKEIEKRKDDFDYIDTVKRQRGRYAQNRTPLV